MIVTFFVDHEPIAQPRQRHAIRNGLAVNYVPKTHPVHAFKHVVRIRARQAYQGKPLTGPLRVSLLFLLPRPKRLIWKTRPMPRCWAPERGSNDADNLTKAILDSFGKDKTTGECFMFLDDAQVCVSFVQKMYAAGDEAPGVLVTIETL